MVALELFLVEELGRGEGGGVQGGKESVTFQVTVDITHCKHWEDWER